nr:MAG TPA: hypothetical protein [Caudoviricetes sp.]
MYKEKRGFLQYARELAMFRLWLYIRRYSKYTMCL